MSLESFEFEKFDFETIKLETFEFEKFNFETVELETVGSTKEKREGEKI